MYQFLKFEIKIQKIRFQLGGWNDRKRKSKVHFTICHFKNPLNIFLNHLTSFKL